MLKYAYYLEYDTNQYPFKRILEAEVFKVRPLEKLHDFWRLQKRKSGKSEVLVHGDNLLLRNLMQMLPDDSSFYKLYHWFIKQEIAVNYGNKLSYSMHPKMRVHLAGTGSVSGWHRDVDITKRVEQINVFLPFVDCFDTNTLWCESDYGLGDYQPLSIKYGQALIFDGGYLKHGSVANVTGLTRVSLDFRFSASVSKATPPWSTILRGRAESLKLLQICDQSSSARPDKMQQSAENYLE